jgi:hypothetical protein
MKVNGSDELGKFEFNRLINIWIVTNTSHIVLKVKQKKKRHISFVDASYLAPVLDLKSVQ